MKRGNGVGKTSGVVVHLGRDVTRTPEGALALRAVCPSHELLEIVIQRVGDMNTVVETAFTRFVAAL